tara:strand:- start:180 stop:464 length:285 start_codon:yes stop_codon:yes gene_type:complete
MIKTIEELKNKCLEFLQEDAIFITFKKYGKKFYCIEYWNTKPIWDNGIKDYDIPFGLIGYQILSNSSALHEQYRNEVDVVEVDPNILRKILMEV